MKNNYLSILLLFTGKLNPFASPLNVNRLALVHKIIRHISDVEYEFLSQSGEPLHTRRNITFPYYPTKPLIFRQITNYKLLCSSLKNNPAPLPSHNHLSDMGFTPPSSPKSLFNFYSSNYEDMSQFTSHSPEPLHLKDSPHDISYYDDMQDNPLDSSSPHITPSSPQFFPRVPDANHIFPHSRLRHSNPLPTRRNTTPYTLRIRS